MVAVGADGALADADDEDAAEEGMRWSMMVGCCPQRLQSAAAGRPCVLPVR